jgi:hypothetical protein
MVTIYHTKLTAFRITDVKEAAVLPRIVRVTIKLDTTNLSFSSLQTSKKRKPVIVSEGNLIPK